MIKRLLWLNGIAALGVVLNHAIFRVVPAMAASIYFSTENRYTYLDRMRMGNLFSIQILDEIAIIAVPLFLFITGWFIGFNIDKKKNTVSWSVIMNRIKNLIIPYLIWSILFLILNVYQGVKYDARILIKQLLIEGVVVPYYYIPMLIVFLLTARFFIPLVMNHWKALLIILLLPQALFSICWYIDSINQNYKIVQLILDFFIFWPAPRHLIWFILGIVLSVHKFDDRFRTRLKPHITFLVVITLIIYTLEVNLLALLSNKAWINPQYTFFYAIFCMSFILYFILYSEIRYPLSTLLGELGKMSFCIYLLHFPIQVVINPKIVSAVPQLMNYPLIWVSVLFLIGLIIPVIFFVLVTRLPLSRYSRYLFG